MMMKSWRSVPYRGRERESIGEEDREARERKIKLCVLL